MIKFTFAPVDQKDFENLLELRISVMREHLERLGRFHPVRARKRFADGFAPENMRKIIVEGQMAGVVSLTPQNDGLELEHFYLYPDFQSIGLGGQVIKCLLREADDQHLPVYLGVLKQSPAARFYERHGFHKTHEEEWDIYYKREMIIP